jgi:hypothetical protein
MQKRLKATKILWYICYKSITLQAVVMYTKFIEETPKFINEHTLRSQQPKKTYFCPKECLIFNVECLITQHVVNQ